MALTHPSILAHELKNVGGKAVSKCIMKKFSVVA